MQSIVGILNLFIILPPLLYHWGITGLAKGMYFMLGFACHQRPDRSFFLFGQHIAYGKGITPFLEGHPLIALWPSNRFVCADSVGCKFGICARCTGIYVGLLGGTVLVAISKKVKIPKIILILLIVPLIIDGVVQLIATLINPFFPWYESTNLRRLITGLMFGFGVGVLMFDALKQDAYGEQLSLK